MKVFDTLHDINVVSDVTDTEQSSYLHYSCWQPQLYESESNRALLVFYSNSATGVESQPSFSIEYGQTSDFASGSAPSGSSYVSTYKKYAMMLLDSPTSKFTYSPEPSESIATETTINNAFFISFNRSFKADEIRKQGFVLAFLRKQQADQLATAASDFIYIYDEIAGDTNTNYKRNLNSDYNTVYWTGSELTSPTSIGQTACGILFYQPGVLVLDAGSSAELIPPSYRPGTAIFTDAAAPGSTAWISGSSNIGEYTWSTTLPLLSSTAWSGDAALWGFWDRLYSGSLVASASAGTYPGIQFYARSELFYQDFYCRAYSYEYNYSSNPTFISGSNNSIRVVDELMSRGSHTYITTVGLYDHNENLLAVAKLSKPVRKDSTNERLVRVRLVQ